MDTWIDGEPPLLTISSLDGDLLVNCVGELRNTLRSATEECPGFGKTFLFGLAQYVGEHYLRTSEQQEVKVLILIHGSIADGFYESIKSDNGNHMLNLKNPETPLEHKFTSQFLSRVIKNVSDVDGFTGGIVGANKTKGNIFVISLTRHPTNLSLGLMVT